MTENRKQKTKNRRQKTIDRKPKTENRRQKTIDRKPKTKKKLNGKQNTGNEWQEKTEDIGQNR